MAKKSVLERQKKRQVLVERYSKKRKIILKELNLIKKSSLNELFNLNKKLHKLPRNSSSTRLRNRCWKTGKPRGFSRFFGLCRNAIRELAHECVLPGITKASW
jgi:small subunit ribosomal protein S14